MKTRPAKGTTTRSWAEVAVHLNGADYWRHREAIEAWLKRDYGITDFYPPESFSAADAPSTAAFFYLYGPPGSELPDNDNYFFEECTPSGFRLKDERLVEDGRYGSILHIVLVLPDSDTVSLVTALRRYYQEMNYVRRCVIHFDPITKVTHTIETATADR